MLLAEELAALRVGDGTLLAAGLRLLDAGVMPDSQLHHDSLREHREYKGRPAPTFATQMRELWKDEQIRELLAAERAEARCYECGAVPPAPGRKRCAACLAEQAARTQRNRAPRLAAGVCVRCEGEVAPGRKRYCLACVEYNKRATKEYRARQFSKGLCGDCGGPLEIQRRSYKTCQGCSNKHRARLKVLRARRKAEKQAATSAGVAMKSLLVQRTADG